MKIKQPLLQAAGDAAPAPADSSAPAPAATPETPAVPTNPPATSSEPSAAQPNIAELIAAEFAKHFGDRAPPEPAPAPEPERAPAGPSFEELQRLARRDPARLAELLGVQDRKGFANRVLLAELGDKAPPEWRQSVQRYELENRIAELESRLEQTSKQTEEYVSKAEVRRAEQEMHREITGWVKGDLGTHGHLATVAEKSPERAQALLTQHFIQFVNTQRKWPSMADVAAAVDKELAELGVVPRSAPVARTPEPTPAVEMQSRPPVANASPSGKSPAMMDPDEFSDYIVGKLAAGR